MLLAAIDGENLTTLYQTNDSVNLDQLLSIITKILLQLIDMLLSCRISFGETFDFYKGEFKTAVLSKIKQ